MKIALRIVSLFPLIFITGCLTSEEKVAASNVAQQAGKQVSEAIKQQDIVRDNLKVPPVPRKCGTKIDPDYKPSDDFPTLTKKADIALFEANSTLVSCYKLYNKNISIRNNSVTKPQ